MRCALLPAVLPLVLASRALAWNVTGHEVVAAEVYDILAKERPQTLAKIITLLKQHPLSQFEADHISNSTHRPMRRIRPCSSPPYGSPMT